MFGVWSGLGLPESRFHTLFALVSQTLMAGICVVDSRLRKRPIVFTAQAALFFLWPVAVPVYLIWSRGWRGILVLAVWVAILAGTMITAGLIAGIVTQ